MQSWLSFVEFVATYEKSGGLLNISMVIDEYFWNYGKSINETMIKVWKCEKWGLGLVQISFFLPVWTGGITGIANF